MLGVPERENRNKGGEKNQWKIEEMFLQTKAYIRLNWKGMFNVSKMYRKHEERSFWNSRVKEKSNRFQENKNNSHVKDQETEWLSSFNHNIQSGATP